MRLRYGLLAIALSVAACSTDEDNLTAPDAGNLVTSATDESDDDLAALVGFSTDLRSNGPLVPGHISLISTITSHVGSSDVELRVTSPDVEAAVEGNWRGGYRLTGRPMQPLWNSRNGMPKDQSTRVPINLNIESPGYYRVIVSAIAHDSQARALGRFVQNEVHDEYWIWVSDSGGRVTKEFDASLFPRNYRRQPGPLMAVQQRRVVGGLTPAANEYALFRIDYVNADSANLPTYVANARVHVKIFDQYEYRVVSESNEGFTDANGRFTAYCPYPSSWDTHIYEVYADNNDLSVNGSTPIATFQLYPGDYLCDDGASTHSLSATTSTARAFTNVTAALTQSRTFFGYSRGKVNVQTGTSKTRYVTASNRIEIRSADIWGVYGRFASSHEYGHALHHGALGGLNPGWADNCDPHYIGSVSSYGCALSEGFADYHAAVTLGAYAGTYYQDIANRTNMSSGPKVEGTVAATFFDLTDGSENPDDNTQYPGFYMATVLKTCQYKATSISGWSRASGVDHIVYCLENSTASRTGHHWSDRSAVFSFSETATEPSGSPPTGWNVTAIFNNWHHNIYFDL